MFFYVLLMDFKNTTLPSMYRWHKLTRITIDQLIDYEHFQNKVCCNVCPFLKCKSDVKLWTFK
jgi:hypothetical protein